MVIELKAHIPKEFQWRTVHFFVITWKGKKKIFFFSVKKRILLPSGNYLETFTVKAAGVTQSEFCINMQILVETFKPESRCATSLLHKLVEYLFIFNQNMFLGLG